MKKSQKKTSETKSYINVIAFVIIIIVALILGIVTKDDILAAISDGISQSQAETNTANTVSEAVVPEGSYEVLKVVDGDTFQIEVNGTKEKVRLIGVDTPESVHSDESKNTEYGKQASEYTKKLLEGKTVTLEFDVQQRDKYGRLLAYVYLNGEMVNKKLLKEGYAQIATFPPNVKYVDEFTKIQEKAKKNGKGFWSENVFEK